MYTNIIVCIDGSEVAMAALEHAIRLTKEQSAALHIVHVIERSSIFWPSLTDERELDFLNLQRDKGEALLHHATNEARHAGVKTTSALLEAGASEIRIAETITAHAEKIGADLIIVGSHGHRGINRLFLGSVAARVAQLCIPPVLIVHGREFAH